MVAIGNRFLSFLLASRATPNPPGGHPPLPPRGPQGPPRPPPNLPPRAGPVCTFPQPCWPSNASWNTLNTTLKGNLFRAKPPAFVCHVPTIDDAACNIAKQRLTNQFWRADQPGGYFDLAWENGDSFCNVDNDPNVPCDQGLVPVYVAKVQNVADVQAAVGFARDNKLAVRVKGASHDFLGRSSGNGTFGISTINLKGINFVDSFVPTGAPSGTAGQTAVTIGAGEHWYFVNEAADAKGVVIVGGQSWSVGAAGGWILGGGHSSLSRQYGLGVDNVLEFEIVTPDGRLRTVNQFRETDLFFALRGGGPGFGVVTKVTYKTYPAITQIVEISLKITYSEDSYRGFLAAWFSIQSILEENGFSGYSFPTPTGFTAELFIHNSGDTQKADDSFNPLRSFGDTERGAGRDFDVQIAIVVLPSYFSIFPTPPDEVDEGAGVALIGGSRLLPLNVWTDKRDALIDVFVNSPGIQMFLLAGRKVSEVAAGATAVHPSWRTATHHVIFSTGWATSTPFDQRNAIRAQLTAQTQALGAIEPGAGSYHNEADVNEPQWPTTFWGSNYNRLVGIKRTIDPNGLFTCRHCVGDQF